MRLKLGKQTIDQINMFLERGHYSTPEEVIAAATQILVDEQIKEDSKTWNESTTPIEHVMSQLDNDKDLEPKKD